MSEKDRASNVWWDIPIEVFKFFSVQLSLLIFERCFLTIRLFVTYFFDQVVHRISPHSADNSTSLILEGIFEVSALLVIVLFQVTHVIKFIRRIIPLVHLKEFIDAVKQLFSWRKNLPDSQPIQKMQDVPSVEPRTVETTPVVQSINSQQLKLVRNEEKVVDSRFFKPYRPSFDPRKIA